MLLELNSDQRLWRDTVRDALAKECPASLVRAIAEGDGDRDPSAPLWKSYVANGWTELTDVEETVELGLLVEELGRATDPTPYLATLTQFNPLAPEAVDPKLSGAAVYDGVTAARVADGWELDGTARHVLDGDRAERIAVSTPAGVFVVGADKFSARRVPVFDPVLHVAEVTFDRVRVAPGDRVVAAHTDHAARAKDVALTGLALTMVGACQRVLDMVLEHVGLATAVRRPHRFLSGGATQGRRYARRDRTGPRPVLLRGVDHRRRRPAPAAGRGHGQGFGR